jgi:hypothetical protein
MVLVPVAREVTVVPGLFTPVIDPDPFVIDHVPTPANGGGVFPLSITLGEEAHTV